jgi:hypothetical protein
MEALMGKAMDNICLWELFTCKLDVFELLDIGFANLVYNRLFKSPSFFILLHINKQLT